MLLALTIDEVTAKSLAVRLDSTPGALYKTLHDARRKLRHELDHEREDHEPSRAEPPSGQPVGGAPTRASGAGCGDALMSGLGAAV